MNDWRSRKTTDNSGTGQDATSAADGMTQRASVPADDATTARSSFASPGTYRPSAEGQDPRYSGYSRPSANRGAHPSQHAADAERSQRDASGQRQTQTIPAGEYPGAGRQGASWDSHRPWAGQHNHGAGAYVSGAEHHQTGAFGPPVATSPRGTSRGPGWPGVIAATLAGALLASGLTFAAFGLGSSSGSGLLASDSTLAQAEPVVTSTTARPDWASVASAVGPTVVAIRVGGATGGGAEGSGVIYDESGHVVTNNHVVQGAAEGQIVVTLSDGQMIPASVVGTDVATDLAVLQLEQQPTGGAIATFGDSDAVVVGDPVAAIGNPLGLSSTVTTGIVSALDRPVNPQAPSDPSGIAVVTNAIQVDASINPGNSGGPLFDAAGRVIGINSSIATPSQAAGSVGLGFAIPSNLVGRVVPQLIEHGRAEHAYLGVSMRSGTATVDGVTRTGAQVMGVEEGTPAADAGLRGGDVIVSIDGNAVGSAEALTGYVRAHSSGDEVRLGFVRGSSMHEVDVQLATRPDAPQ